MSPKLKNFAALHTPLTLKELSQYFAEQKKEAETLTPHLLHSIKAIEDFALRGGKSVRSLLSLLSFRLVGGKSDGAYKVAAAVELFHKHILNIDDMADRDEQRNGGPTLWKYYVEKFEEMGWPEAAHHGRTLSEIDGTLMGSFCFELVRTSDFSAESKLAVMEVMNRTMYWRTVAGWEIHYFQNHQHLAEASESEFIKGLELVTADYTFVAPLKIGLILAEKLDDPQFVEPLMAYAREVGRAFQVHDDILGLFGDPEVTGKAVGNDVREGKKTLLVQRAYAAASEKDKKFLNEVCGKNISASELAKIQEIVRDTGSLAYSQELEKKSVEAGVAGLKKILLTHPELAEKEEFQVLEELAYFVIEREK